MVEWKVVKKNRWGHRFIEEPVERIAYRKKCKHNGLFGCNKGYRCYEANNRKRILDTVIVGCTPNVDCPLLSRWDKRHGLEGSYTILENKRMG